MKLKVCEQITCTDILTRDTGFRSVWFFMKRYLSMEILEVILVFNGCFV